MKTLPTSYRMTVVDAILCLALAYRIHGTEMAVIATAYRVRELVAASNQPLFTRIIRCRSAMTWTDAYLKAI